MIHRLTAALAAALSCYFVLTGAAEGQQLRFEWAAQIATNEIERAEALAFDAVGNVYVTGVTQGLLGDTAYGTQDVFITKVSPSGSLLWSQQIGKAGANVAGDVAIDADGNVIVVGSFGVPSLTDKAFFIHKVSPSGETHWTQQGVYPPGSLAYGVAADGDNNIYVTGEIDDPGNRDIFLYKISETGGLLWARLMGEAEGSRGSDIAIDSAGNPVITGTVWGGETDGYDAFTSKFNAAGDLLWGQRVGTQFDDEGLTLAIDGQDNIVVAGNWGQGDSAASGSQPVVWKHDPAGDSLWFNQYEGSGEGDTVRGLAIDSDNGVYFVGATSGQVGPTQFGGVDAYLTALSPDGDGLWASQFGSWNYDEANAIGVFNGDEFYLAITSASGLAGPSLGLTDVFLIKYVAVPEPVSSLLIGLMACVLVTRRPAGR
ncbi:Beta-propeller repeat protein [Pseudobythopirellula maris]|uniref:Beta-propeller repeat protein n=1 Tax=Pseudobythopirellula maris TaxID=2527991 RepID=A0A5C5ZNR2_9BACT|nr:hypothetical protein [Pseudobythopirellula maris]TWT89089.1 Beta-propeller repeat protein [Pseudobythopirellula maris]